MNQRPCRLWFAICALLLPASVEAGNATHCSLSVHLATIDLGEKASPDAEPGATGFVRALTNAIGTESHLAFSVRKLPYARAGKEIRDGQIDGLIISETTMDALDVPHESIPLMQIETVLYRNRSAGESGRGARVVGLLNGFALPAPLRAQGYRVYTVSSYETLFRMFAANHLSEMVLARPASDAALASFRPPLRNLDPPSVLERQTVAFHVRESLLTDCREQLLTAAVQVRKARLEALFHEALPGVSIDDFLLTGQT